MKNIGLARGARLRRLWITLKRPVLIHPLRGAIYTVLLLPGIAVIILLTAVSRVARAIGHVFETIDDLCDGSADDIGEYYSEFIETKREERLRFWARVYNGEKPEGWHLDPESRRLVKDEEEEDNA